MTYLMALSVSYIIVIHCWDSK